MQCYMRSVSVKVLAYPCRYWCVDTRLGCTALHISCSRRRV